VSLKPRALLVGGSVWTYSAFLLRLERRLNLARLHKAQDALQLAYSMPHISGSSSLDRRADARSSQLGQDCSCEPITEPLTPLSCCR
jgi:hypothetical protein